MQNEPFCDETSNGLDGCIFSHRKKLNEKNIIELVLKVFQTSIPFS